MVKIILFFIALSLAAVFDIRKREIPDWIPLLIAGISLIPPGGVRFNGLIVALPLLVVGITIGGIGGGDIKLMGACGLVLGVGQTFAGLIMGLVFLILFHAGRQGIRAIQKKNSIKGKEQAYPLVPFLLLGMLLSIRMGG